MRYWAKRWVRGQEVNGGSESRIANGMERDAQVRSNRPLELTRELPGGRQG